jgi:hypothetical protein
MKKKTKYTVGKEFGDNASRAQMCDGVGRLCTLLNQRILGCADREELRGKMIVVTVEVR